MLFEFGWKVVVEGIYVMVLNVVVEFSNTVVGIDVEAVETSSGVVVGLCVVDVEDAVVSSVVIVGFFVVDEGAVEPFSVVVVGLFVVDVKDVETFSVVVVVFCVVEVGAVDLSSVVVAGSCVVVLMSQSTNHGQLHTSSSGSKYKIPMGRREMSVILAWRRIFGINRS